MRPPELDATQTEGQAAGRAYFATLTIPQLRRRQSLTQQQMRIAYAQRNEDALEQLNATLNLLTEAVYVKAFGRG